MQNKSEQLLNMFIEAQHANESIACLKLEHAVSDNETAIRWLTIQDGQCKERVMC